MAQELGYRQNDISIDETLYDAEASDILQVVRILNNEADVVMVFGHNPGMTDLVHKMWPPITHLPTCAVAEFSFDVTSWSEIGDIKPTDVALMSPKQN